MGCNCGSNSTSTSVPTGDCSSRKAMDTNKPLKQIQNGDENFCFSEITDEMCKNIGSNEGIHPSAKHSNTTCDDLKALNDLGLGTVHNDLMTLDLCDIAAWKCWLFELISWLWNILRAIICAVCGLWCTIDKMKAVIMQLAYANVETVGAYDVQESTPELSVIVNNDGTFRYNWSDWVTPGVNRLGHGTLTGKINYTMKTNAEGGLDYKISGVHLDKVVYTTDGKPSPGSEPRYYILIPSNGTQVWSRQGTTYQSWSETFNKTYAFDKSGTINPHSESDYIYFMTWGADWVNDDKVQLKFRFVNNNDKISLDC